MPASADLELRRTLERRSEIHSEREKLRQNNRELREAIALARAKLESIRAKEAAAPVPAAAEASAKPSSEADRRMRELQERMSKLREEHQHLSTANVALRRQVEQLMPRPTRLKLGETLPSPRSLGDYELLTPLAGGSANPLSGGRSLLGS
eukprot:gnl/TRDRNA2_/TRDRNA2_191015_c0_seq1.p1 gnl/TRDRNA2_/TRDRNA2_191015_c0~~gnl/TRDRNA2_/TRDRNA2_191015_c0_seq1.p1  ORF type:complete len:175 (-),score=28.12 gnl/TRDRNA2_/TRDRNA2_191015_c0_seq1:34-486(-)